jgi:predicted alpha/beta-hydrolase family hydrolase
MLKSGVSVTRLSYVAEAPRLGRTLILAHGAGAGQRSPFIVSFASALAARGIDVVTFNFPYSEQHRRVPDRRPTLEACFSNIIDDVRMSASRDAVLFIGGKSMGARIATHVAAAERSLPVAGLILLGYPLHPPGRAAERRDSHLADVGRPMLIVQGSRDAFGFPSEFDSLLERLSPRPTFCVVDGGDHSFRISRGEKTAQQTVYSGIQRTIADWIAALG